MRFAADVFVSLDTMPDIASPRDDIDTLFDKLQSLEPPPAVISRILGLSGNSSMSPILSAPALRDPWQGFQALAFSNDKRNPC